VGNIFGSMSAGMDDAEYWKRLGGIVNDQGTLPIGMMGRVEPGTQALGMFGGVPLKPASPASVGIKAYHGSPHDFEQFDTGKIGTGEGAQAYGHGLYFADKEGVAQGYRDTLSRRNVTGKFDGQPLNNQRDWWNAIDKLNEQDWRQGKFLDLYGRLGGDKEWFVKQMRDDYRDQPDMLDALGKWDARMEASHRPGKMYEVNIRADPSHFLDWDKPLSNQAAPVQAALEGLGIKSDKEGLRAFDNALLQQLQPDTPFAALPKQPQDPSGEQLYQMARNAAYERGATSSYADEKPAASRVLQQAGIPGIKYLDQGSRGAGEGSRNYVVFDHNLIEIIKKYGIAAVLGAGLLGQDVTQMRNSGRV
jgi:hypothetical protein